MPNTLLSYIKMREIGGLWVRKHRSIILHIYKKICQYKRKSRSIRRDVSSLQFFILDSPKLGRGEKTQEMYEMNGRLGWRGKDVRNSNSEKAGW